MPVTRFLVLEPAFRIGNMLRRCNPSLQVEVQSFKDVSDFRAALNESSFPVVVIDALEFSEHALEILIEARTANAVCLAICAPNDAVAAECYEAEAVVISESTLEEPGIEELFRRLAKASQERLALSHGIVNH